MITAERGIFFHLSDSIIRAANNQGAQPVPLESAIARLEYRIGVLFGSIVIRSDIHVSPNREFRDSPVIFLQSLAVEMDTLLKYLFM